MPKRPAEAASPFISRISLVGRDAGRVKALAGFKKQHHTVPDAVNAATEGFLAKLCATELATEAEQFFQRAKSAFGYKRTELALAVSSPVAVLTAKDFTLEIAYALQPDDPAGYGITRTLHSLSETEGAARPELNELFAAKFSGIVFDLVKGVPVEAVIDAVEARGGEDGLAVRLSLGLPELCDPGGRSGRGRRVRRRDAGDAFPASGLASGIGRGFRRRARGVCAVAQPGARGIAVAVAGVADPGRRWHRIPSGSPTPATKAAQERAARNDREQVKPYLIISATKARSSASSLFVAAILALANSSIT